MQGNEHQLIVLIIMTGVLLLAAMLAQLIFERIVVPPIVGFLLLGFAIRSADSTWPFLTVQAIEILAFFAQIGIITLLFRAGLESELKGLLGQLKNAMFVWAANVLVSGMLGFFSAYYLLNFGVVTSLFVGAAFTATSIGVSIEIWQKHGATATQNGQLLLDVAELDDISAVILMAVLFSLVPVLHSSPDVNVIMELSGPMAIFFAKLMVFIMVCYFFASFGEHPFIQIFRRLDPPPLAILAVIGISLIIAGFAGLLGFSVAIGAFFAGLVFSRDPDTVKMEASFLPLYQFFSPFFFIGIGLNVSPDCLDGGVLTTAAVLFLVAVGGKLVANYLPILFMKGHSAGILIGVSMIPRAEIAMIIMQGGMQLGTWAVPQKVFDAMALVTLLTCSLSPPVINILLEKWPQTVTGKGAE